MVSVENLSTMTRGRHCQIDRPKVKYLIDPAIGNAYPQIMGGMGMGVEEKIGGVFGNAFSRVHLRLDKGICDPAVIFCLFEKALKFIENNQLLARDSLKNTAEILFEIKREGSTYLFEIKDYHNLLSGAGFRFYEIRVPNEMLGCIYPEDIIRHFYNFSKISVVSTLMKSNDLKEAIKVFMGKLGDYTDSTMAKLKNFINNCEEGSLEIIFDKQDNKILCKIVICSLDIEEGDGGVIVTKEIGLIDFNSN